MTSPRFDPQIYLDTYKDVKNWWQQGKQRGEAGGRGLYYQQHGRDTSGWEKNWVKNMNKKYGTNKTDMGQFTRDQYLQEHFDRYGKKEGRLRNQSYVRNFNAAPEQVANQDDYFNVDRFNTLLGELEASKGRQVRQKAVEGRRDTFATGLSSMMSNF